MTREYFENRSLVENRIADIASNILDYMCAV
jgi:hypothetical protein